MKLHLDLLFVLAVLIVTQTLHAEEYEAFDSFESVGNGAIYNATNQTVHLNLTGDGKNYKRSLGAGAVRRFAGRRGDL